MTDTSKPIENLSDLKKYKDIFDKVEISLKKASVFSKLEFVNQYDKFKKFGNRKRDDDELFEMLTMIVFYSGFRASTVESKEKIILKHFPDYKAVSIILVKT